MTRAGRIFWTRCAVIGLLVGLLEATCRLGWISHLVIIPPSEMVAAMVSLLGTEEVLASVAQTFSTVAIAFVAAVVLGFALGAAIHGLPRLRRAIDPLLASYYSVPFFVFYPLLVALFGLNELPLIAIGFLFALPAMLIATLLGLDRVPLVLRKVARMHRLGWGRTAMLVILPAALPNLFQGIKLALAYAFIGVIAGEFILATAGLGRRLTLSYNSFDTATMYGLILLIFIAVAILNSVLQRWEARIHRRWYRA